MHGDKEHKYHIWLSCTEILSHTCTKYSSVNHYWSNASFACKIFIISGFLFLSVQLCCDIFRMKKSYRDKRCSKPFSSQNRKRVTQLKVGLFSLHRHFMIIEHWLWIELYQYFLISTFINNVNYCLWVALCIQSGILYICPTTICFYKFSLVLDWSIWFQCSWNKCSQSCLQC